MEKTDISKAVDDADGIEATDDQNEKAVEDANRNASRAKNAEVTNPEVTNPEVTNPEVTNPEVNKPEVNVSYYYQ
jgi:hypothetical protein